MSTQAQPSSILKMESKDAFQWSLSEQVTLQNDCSLQYGITWSSAQPDLDREAGMPQRQAHHCRAHFMSEDS